MAVSIRLPWIHGSRYCPVSAWVKYSRHQKGLPSDPAFMTPGGTPLTPKVMTEVLRQGLHQAGHPHAQSLTLHGMRRGAAQACIKNGASLQSVKDLGTWLSDAVYAYVPKTMVIEAPIALSYSFGSGRFDTGGRCSQQPANLDATRSSHVQ